MPERPFRQLKQAGSKSKKVLPMEVWKPYTEKDSMAALVTENYYMLFVLSRFGIPMGFGEGNIGQVCRQRGVDPKTFLAVVNLNLQAGSRDGAIDEDVHPETIAEYLHNSHEYFLKYRLPALRERLEKAMDRKHEAEVSEAVMRFFDEYVSEVEKHMMYEEEVVFPYVRALVEGASGGDYRISVFRKRHDQIESRLTELRDILVKYYRGKNGYAFNAALFDIFTCAEDLREHNQVEDALLVPLIEKLERKTVCGKS